MAKKLNAITAVRLRDEQSGKLAYEFRVPDGSEGGVSVLVPHDLSPREIRKILSGYSTNQINEIVVKALVNNQSLPLYVTTNQPGWKAIGSQLRPSVFVANNWMIPPHAPFRLLPEAEPKTSYDDGDVSAWVAGIAPFAAKSNFVTFAICAALAAPLVPYSGLPENPIFNLFGDSSVGKTTGVKVGQAVAGPTGQIQQWNNSARRFDEIAAEHNHLLLVLNAIELVPVTKRSSRVQEIAHLFPEGRSAGRSKSVRETLPNLSWQGVMLSTSNHPASALVSHWADQDLARFIDIPVPAQDVGGIFDRLDVANASNEAATLITLLEEQLKFNQGALLKPWIEYLTTIDIAVEVRSWMDEFLAGARPTPGLETRIANKFAIIYAAGMLARKAKLLDLNSFKSDAAVDLLYERSVDHRRASSNRANVALAAFKQVVKSKDGIFEVDLSSSEMIEVRHSEEMIGMNCDYNGQAVLALRRDGLIAKFGPDGAKAILDFAARTELLMAGHGGKAAVQLTIGLKIGEKLSSRPRFHVLNAEKLTKLLETI